MRAIGSFRETKDGSLAAQSEAFLAFCKKNGFEAAATFIDTRADQELPGFRQLMDFVRQQEGQGFLLVVVPQFMTLGASPVEAARRYFQLSSLGVRSVSIDNENEIARCLVATLTA